MRNPLEEPVPDDKIEQVHTYARDYVYGVSKGLWGAESGVISAGGSEDWVNFDSNDSAFAKLLQKTFVNTGSAEEYEFAVSKLLNALGYATY